MLNRNEILRIERTLAKLQEGDLYDPVAVSYTHLTLPTT